MRGLLWLAFGVIAGTIVYRAWPRPTLVERQPANQPIARENSDVNATAPTTNPAPGVVAANVKPAVRSDLVNETPIDLAAFAQKLERLAACQEGGCAYPETDPRSYDFALNDDVAQTLTNLTKFVVAEKMDNVEQVSEIARANLQSGNGFVQEAALLLIATQPASHENLRAILEGVIGGSDPDLIQRGLDELQRYQDAVDIKVINDSLGAAMMTGAPFIAEQVSLRLKPFINNASLGFYRGVMEQLPPDSIYRGNLETTLNAFHGSN